jgi:hypothetical protein
MIFDHFVFRFGHQVPQRQAVIHKSLADDLEHRFHAGHFVHIDFKGGAFTGL